MNHIGLFEGIGGFSLAAKWMNWDTIAVCEINTFCQTVLKHHFPNATLHTDIRTTDFTGYRGQCDILTGGFPCQPYSVAGARKGTEDARHLWPHMLRAVREINPTWVVGENVRGLVSWNGGLVFDQVQTDLEAEGYEVLPFILPACAVDAPHRRERVWFVAYSRRFAGQRRQSAKNGSEHNGQGGRWEKEANNVKRLFETGSTPDTENDRVENGRQHGIHGGQEQPGFEGVSSSRNATDALCNTGTEIQTETRRPVIGSQHFGDGEARRTGFGSWPTQSPVRAGNDGLSGGLDGITFSKWRNESIKAAGNAIVPQVAFEIYKVIRAINAVAE